MSKSKCFEWQPLALKVHFLAILGSTVLGAMREGMGHYYCAGSCCPISDRDGDQLADLVLGCPWSLDEKGQVWIVSSATGNQLGSIRGHAEWLFFGRTVYAAADVDVDGHPEIAVSAKRSAKGTYQVHLYSGLSYNRLWSVDLGSEYGPVFASAGDWNEDGSDDLLVGVPSYRTNKNSAEGAVLVLSGKDGSVLARRQGSEPLQCLGSAIAQIADLNADGRRDFAVSAVRGDPTDAVYVLSGKDLSVLRVHASDRNAHMFGSALMQINDLNGDGMADLAIGVSDGGDGLISYVYVMCMKSGQILRNIVGPKEAAFGSSLVYLPAEKDRPARLLIGAYDYAVFSGAVYCHDLSTDKTTLLHPPLNSERKLGNEIRWIPREGTDQSQTSMYAVMSCDESSMKGKRYLTVAKLYRADNDKLLSTFHLRDECKLIVPPLQKAGGQK